MYKLHEQSVSIRYGAGPPTRSPRGNQMHRISASNARQELAEILNRVAYGKERVVIGRRGKELAAVIPIADLRLLERLAEEAEDRLDADDARRILTDAGDELVPWDAAKRELTAAAVHRPGEAERPARPRSVARRGPRPARPRHRRSR